MKTAITGIVIILFVCGIGYSQKMQGMKVDTFLQEVKTVYSSSDGLPDDNVHAIAIRKD